MNERPIIFSAAMVRAILDGQKSQTRRIIKPQPPYGCEYSINSNGTNALCHTEGPIDNKTRWVPPTPNSADHRLPSPYGIQGDRLWVRETFADEAGGTRKFLGDHIYYRADGEADLQGGRWSASIHMPRWASRIRLKIARISVERVQDISESDAKAEGAKLAVKYDDGYITSEPRIVERELHSRSFAFGFEGLWRQIHGSKSWDSNPWVWVIEFKVIEERAQ
jgi:hypothetical protein